MERGKGKGSKRWKTETRRINRVLLGCLLSQARATSLLPRWHAETSKVHHHRKASFLFPHPPPPSPSSPLLYPRPFDHPSFALPRLYLPTPFYYFSPPPPPLTGMNGRLGLCRANPTGWQVEHLYKINSNEPCLCFSFALLLNFRSRLLNLLNSPFAVGRAHDRFPIRSPAPFESIMVDYTRAVYR